MRFLYVSRQFNRSGYYILEHLLENTPFRPMAVLMPKPASPLPLNDEERAAKEIEAYQEHTRSMNGTPLRFMKSIEQLARLHKINVVLEETIKGDAVFRRIQEMAPDLIVLGGGWPQLIPERVLELPRLGAINTHPSLLPDFRGTDIHRWQVRYDVRQSGTTIHYMDERFDTGDVIGQNTVQIERTDTPQALFEKTAQAAGPLMESVLKSIESMAPKKVTGNRQPERDKASRYYSKWRWDDQDFLRLDWSRAAVDLERLVLACTQESYIYNGPWFSCDGATYLVREAWAVEDCGPQIEDGQPGQIFRHANGYPIVRCGQGALTLDKVQEATSLGFPKEPHHRPALSGEEWLQQHHIPYENIRSKHT